MGNKFKECLQAKQREGTNQTEAAIEILKEAIKFNELGYLDESSSYYEILKDLVVLSPQKKKETIYQALRNTLGRKEIVQDEGLVYFLMKIIEPLMEEDNRVFIPYANYGEIASEFALTYKNSRINCYEANNQNFQMLSLLNDVLGTNINLQDKNFIYESVENNNHYDIVIISSPMGMRLDVESIGIEKMISSRKVTSEAASLIKGIETVEEGGYIVCSLPQSFLYSNLNKDIRDLLLKKCDVMLLTDAPKKCLLNTNITMSIMVLRKKSINTKEPKEFIAATFENLSIEDEQFKKEVEELLTLWKEFVEGEK